MGAVRLLQKAILFCIFAHVFNDSKLMKITKVKEKNGTMQKPVSTELSAVVEQMRGAQYDRSAADDRRGRHGAAGP